MLMNDANSRVPSGGSWFADRAAARRALAMALPMIEPLVAERDVVGSGFLYIVVMDPARGPGECAFDDAVLLEHAVGDRSKWDADYAAFARAKARLSWWHGQATHSLQACSPHRLREGDTLLDGSVWLDGIVVAVSGAHPPYDEAFATCIAACLRALARQRHADALAQRRLFAGE
jgi:hypothetical protein